MKRLLSMLLVMCMVITMLPMAVFAEEAKLVYSGTLELAEGEIHTIEYDAPSAGTVYIEVSSVSSGARFTVGNSLGQEATAATTLVFENVIPVTNPDDEYHNNISVKGYQNYGEVAVNVTITVTFVPATDGDELPKEEYRISEDSTFVDARNYTVAMLNDTALVTLVNFTPSATGVYKFSVGADAKIKNCGSVNYAYGYDTLAEDGTQIVEWTCTDINQSMVLGIYAPESDTVTVNLSKTGEYVEQIIELRTYENKAEVSQFVLPEGAVLGNYINVKDTVEHSAVLGSDGYYHLDKADGPVLLLDMVYNKVILTDKLNSDIPTMYAYVPQADGSQIKYDIAAAVQAYEKASCEIYEYDENDKPVLCNRYYPLTEDLMFFYKDYATAQGVWIFNGLESTDAPNADAWLYCCRVMYTGDIALEDTLSVGVDGAYWTALQSGTVYFTAEPATLAVDITTEEDVGTVLYTIQDGVGQYDVEQDTTYVFWLPEGYEGDEVVNVTWSYAAPAGDGEETPDADCEHTYFYACDAHCMNCGELTNPDAKHTVEHVAAKAATCAENGNIEYWYCTACGCVWANEALTQVTNRMNVMLFAEHSYFYACDAFCMNCGELTNEEAAHSIKHVEAVEATCQQPGNIEYWSCEYCNMCWDNENGMGMPLNAMMVKVWKDHEYFNSCDAYCMLCGEETNPDAKHTVEHVAAKDATCAETGNLEYWYCTVCGAAWLDQACTLNTNQKAVVLPKLEAVATIGSAQYASVSEALEAAKAGETVTLVADAKETYVIITPGVTLNLGSYDLTADYVIGLKGSKLTGDRYRANADYGKLIVGKDSVVLSSDPYFNASGYALLPIWMENGGYYQFMQCIFNSLEATAAEGTMTIRFFPATNNTEMGLFAANGVDDYGLSIVVRVSYAEEQSAGDVLVTKEYFYTEDLVKNSYENRARLTVAMGGCDELKDLVFTLAVVSETGIVYNSESFPYPHIEVGNGPNPF